MKILVTGGGGFLGSAICRQLLARGDQVIAYQRSASDELEKLGVTKIFTPGAPTEEAIKFLNETINSKPTDEKIM